MQIDEHVKKRFCCRAARGRSENRARGAKETVVKMKGTNDCVPNYSFLILCCCCLCRLLSFLTNSLRMERTEMSSPIGSFILEFSVSSFFLSFVLHLSCLFYCMLVVRAQYYLTVKYLCEMTEEQTLVMMSGHPSRSIFQKRQEEEI